MNTFPVSTRDGEQSLLSPHESNSFCFVLCLWVHHNVTDTSFDEGFSKRLTVATWPPHGTGMWDTSGFLCFQPLKPDPVTNIRALLCPNKHPEHWNQAWKNKAVFKVWYPSRSQGLALIRCLISEWSESLKNYTLAWGYLSSHYICLRGWTQFLVSCALFYS